MGIKKIILGLLGLLIFSGLTIGLLSWLKRDEGKKSWTEKKISGFVLEVDSHKLVLDDGVYVYSFNNLEKGKIFLVDKEMRAETTTWEVLKEYAKLEQKIEVNYLLDGQKTEILEVVISLNKAWSGELAEIDLENKTISLRGNNKTLVFANDKNKGNELKPGDKVNIWVDYDRILKKFIINEIQLYK